MGIYASGQLNVAALQVPGLYVTITPPALLLLNGVPTNVGGLVGTASWGPVGKAVLVSGPADYQPNFGPVLNRKYDMGTFVQVGAKQGNAGVYACLRVTDGTDAAATASVQTNCLSLTAKYTGSGGNQLQFLIATGSAPNSFRAIVYLPFAGSEVFDNITGTGAAFWANVAAAINSGQGVSRGASQFVVAAAGAGTTTPVLGSTTFSGGTDGATTITGTVLLGVDTTPRKGMYALRGVGCSVAALCDCDDDTTLASQIAFGLNEGVLMVATGAAGETISSASTARTTGGIDSYALERMLGDWVYTADEANGLNRYVSPQAFEVGLLVNLSPERTSLNKPMQGIIGTQRSATGAKYSDAELQVLGTSGLSVICNPIPRGNVFGNRFGRNTSSNVGIHQVAYTRLTNFIAQTLNQGMGLYVGELQSRRADDTTRNRAAATLNAFLGTLAAPDIRMIDDFQVICDLSNNPVERIAAGYLKAAVKVVYLAVVEYFLIDVEGGQTVQITKSANAPAGYAFTTTAAAA
ncbi:hypothetical protein ACLBYG_22390 [Methylobacterium sp. D53M]